MKMAVSNILQWPVFRPLLSGLVLWVACTSTIQASDSLSKDWEFTGFGTLGYAHSDKYSDLILKRNVSQRSQTIEDNGWLVDSRLGFQLNKEINHHWDVISQVVAREKTRNTLENSIELAFLRYQSNQVWGIQLGRIPLDIFLLSDHLDVGYSYHWVRPPTEFYGWIPFSHLNGFKSSFEFIHGDQLLRLDAYLGRTEATLNIAYPKGGSTYNTAKANPVLGLGLSLETSDLILRANVTHFRISDDIEAVTELKTFVNTPAIQTYWPEASQIAQDYSLEDAQFYYLSLGFAWHPGSWVFQGELADIGSDSFGTYDGQRAYFQLGHRLNQFLPHITYSRSWDDRFHDYPYDPAPASPQALASGTLETLETALSDNRFSGIVNQYTISIGIRWDFSTQKALKLQCDRSKIKDGSLGLYPTTRSAPRNWQTDTRVWCSGTFDWVF